ncbi:MAG: hypothetical protein IKO42_03775, partial [Opitutales bacterium]|nr:hypothetical protein [Opitutales bacterium]
MKSVFFKAICAIVSAAFLPLCCGAGEAAPKKAARAVEVELSGEVAAPQVYIIRRAVKEASGA